MPDEPILHPPPPRKKEDDGTGNLTSAEPEIQIEQTDEESK